MFLAFTGQIASTALVATIMLIGSNAPFLKPVVPPDEASRANHPAALHTGSCSNLGEVTELLADLVEPTSSPEGVIPASASVTVVAIPLDRLFAAPHAIAVALSHEHPEIMIACGTIGGEPLEGNLVVGLAEHNASGYTGIAWLHDNADGTTTITLFLALRHPKDSASIVGITSATHAERR
jgi:hypothetical protein